MTCFSRKNGPAWHHFIKEDIEELFRDWFEIVDVTHQGSVEGDGVVRYFYTFLMRKN